ncbi:MAG: hypothetical protein E7096_01455 [Bacteroides sp.]|nr:hypothetical protein [Bacteroides sp.]
MNDIIRLQTQVTTGRLTLPVVVLFCLLLWAVSFQQWSDWGSIGILALTGYLMIELNTAFSLIRTRTVFHVAFFWYLMSSLFYLHAFEWTHFVPIFFILSVYKFFASYESSEAPSHVFHSFLFLAAGSLLFPPLLYYIPLFLCYMASFRALSIKSILGGLLGLATPYWFLFGHAFWHEEMSLFYHPFQELIHFHTISYSTIPIHEWTGWIVTTTLLIGYIMHYLQVAYQNKNRTRIYLSFIVGTSLWTTVFILLQPQHLSVLWPVQLLGTSFLATHSFTLTRNRMIGIYFIITFVALITLTCFNLWMLFYNS